MMHEVACKFRITNFEGEWMKRVKFCSLYTLHLRSSFFWSRVISVQFFALSTMTEHLMRFLTIAKSFTRRSSDEPGSEVDYDLRKQLAHDTLLNTDVEHNKDLFGEIMDHGKMIDMEKYRQKFLSRIKDYSKHRVQKNRFQHRENWKGKNKKIYDSYKKVSRESREEDSEDDSDDGDAVQSKDEEDDEDVQLIIIPKKPRKHLHTKVREDENDDEASKGKEEVDENSENKNSENSQHESENSFHRPRGHKTSDDGDVSIETSDVQKDKDGRGGSDENGDYDLKVKVKDKSGTKVKLSGDLLGNIGNLVAEGKGGAKVQIKNTNNKAGGNEDDTASETTNDVAQTLMKMKSGKLKHAPYPSTILLKQPQSQELSDMIINADEGTTTSDSKRTDEKQGMGLLKSTDSEMTINADEGTTKSDSERTDEKQGMGLLKSKDSDGYFSDEFSKTVLKHSSQDQAVADSKEQTDKQTNNIFSPMEFKNADDEIVATSRLLDIARRADDESSLKDAKDSSNSKSTSSDNGKWLRF